MRLTRPLLVALVTASCATTGTTPPTGSSVPPSRTASSSPTPVPSGAASVRPSSGLALLIGANIDATGGTYRLLLVDASGRVVARTSAKRPSAGGINLPLVSASGTHIYYADGDDTIRSLDESGSTEIVRRVAGSRSDRVVFAVDPDDSVIVLASIHYEPAPAAASGGFVVSYGGLAVEPLRGGARTELRPARAAAATDVSNVQFPVGWVSGGLLLGVGPAYVQNPGYLTTSSATSYEIVDPKTGATRVKIAPPDCLLTGTAAPAGTACMPLNGPTVTVYNWSASAIATLRPSAQIDAPAALSPSAARVAVATRPASAIVLLAGTSTASTGIAGRPIGWLDDEHLLFTNGGVTSVYDVVTGGVAQVQESIATEPLAPFFAVLRARAR